MSWEDGLTNEQRIAASYVGGPARLLAGPGTGKTRVLKSRILYLIQVLNVNPNEILALTFTRNAAYELRQRVEKELDGQELPRISTLHSFALRQLLRNAGRLAVLPQPLRIADDYEERRIILEDLKNQLKLRDIKAARELFTLMSADWECNAGIPTALPNPQFIGGWTEHRNIFGYTLRSELVYQLKKSLEQVQDFSLENPISYLLVDEYQDLNPCDLAIVKKLTENGSELFVAGDDDQSIYGFRHAFPDGIRNFSQDYPNSQDLQLTICKRCDSQILDIGEYVANLDYTRIKKHTVAEPGGGEGSARILSFANQQEEAMGVATICEKLIYKEKMDPGSILVLLRSDYRGVFSEELINAFEARPVPIPIHTNLDSADPLDSKFGRQVLSLIRISQQSRDHLAWRTILQEKDNNIGVVILDDLYNFAHLNGLDFTQALENISADPTVIKRYGSRIKAEVSSISETAKRVSEIINQGVIGSDTLENIITNIINEILDKQNPEKLKIQDRILDIANKTSSKSILELLIALESSSPEIEQDRDPHKVNILTMHKAKGLDADVVFIVAAEDEHIPGRYQREPSLGDERRLLFVSITRAKHLLYITYCNKRQGRQRMSGRNPGVASRSLTSFLRYSGLRPINWSDFEKTL